MIEISIDEKTVNSMVEKVINEKVEKIVRQKYFLTYNELSKYLNISKPIIEDRLIKNGLKYYKVGAKYLFKKNEVDEFLDSMTLSMSITSNDLKFYKRVKKNTK